MKIDDFEKINMYNRSRNFSMRVVDEIAREVVSNLSESDKSDCDYCTKKGLDLGFEGEFTYDELALAAGRNNLGLCQTEVLLHACRDWAFDPGEFPRRLILFAMQPIKKGDEEYILGIIMDDHRYTRCRRAWDTKSVEIYAYDVTKYVFEPMDEFVFVEE